MKTLGIDLGGTQIKLGIVEEGKVLRLKVCDTCVQEGYEAVVARIAGEADSLLRAYPDTEDIGMGVPGIIDCEAGVVCYSNNFDWNLKPVCKDLQERLGRRVRIANDAQCAALGEARYGAGRGVSRMAMVTLGTGVGGGYVKDGRLETDRYGAMAYIFGHAVLDLKGRLCNCGRQGCLEAYASASALERKSAGLYAEEKTAKELFELAREGDTGACKIIEEYLTVLSAGIVNIANMIRPERIVIGGGVSASGDILLPAINRELEQGVYGYEYAPVHAVCAELGNQAGVVGAAGL